MLPVKVNASEIIIHRCKATAYSLKGITADGTVVDGRTDIAASKPEWIGCTCLIFEDDGDGIIKPENWIGIYEIRDTGSEKIKNGSVIDIHVADYETAKQFGRKNVIVQIIKSEG